MNCYDPTRVGMHLGDSNRAEHDAGCIPPLLLAMANLSIVAPTDRNDRDDQPRGDTLSNYG
ncbi:MAG: hypothetical protein E6H45_02265 [Betaproteobacteria bacterium]|nr:MAG: hypothetical protein E6H45_02265 [Betaproteobacteria bacterium]